jgi:hypothetical protein
MPTRNELGMHCPTPHSFESYLLRLQVALTLARDPRPQHWWAQYTNMREVIIRVLRPPVPNLSSLVDAARDRVDSNSRDERESGTLGLA